MTDCDCYHIQKTHKTGYQFLRTLYTFLEPIHGLVRGDDFRIVQRRLKVLRASIKKAAELTATRSDLPQDDLVLHLRTIKVLMEKIDRGGNISHAQMVSLDSDLIKFLLGHYDFLDDILDCGNIINGQSRPNSEDVVDKRPMSRNHLEDTPEDKPKGWLAKCNFCVCVYCISMLKVICCSYHKTFY